MAAAALLDVVADHPNIPSENSGISPGTRSEASLTYAKRQVARMFAYVSAARLARSSRQRWAAIHNAIQILWDDSEALGHSVTVAHLDQLFSMDPLVLHSVLPQLLYCVLARNGPVANEVEAFLLRSCTASHSFAFELYWLLLSQPSRAAAAADEDGSAPLAESAGVAVSAGYATAAAAEPAIAASQASSTHDVKLSRLLAGVEATLEQWTPPTLPAAVDASSAPDDDAAALGDGGGAVGDGDDGGGVDGDSTSSDGDGDDGGGAAGRGGGSGGGTLALAARDSLCPSPFANELHLVRSLTYISEQLRSVPREQRLQRLRAALGRVNQLLPAVGAGMGIPAWRPFVPLTGAGAKPHAIARLFEDEAFVLATKERVPYLVFVEVRPAHDRCG